MNITLSEASVQYIDNLRSKGKSQVTVNAYRSDLKILLTFFKPEMPLNHLSHLLMGRFLKSDIILNRPTTGQARATISRNRIIRTNRQFLLWAYSQQLIPHLPLPKAAIPSASSRKGKAASMPTSAKKS